MSRKHNTKHRRSPSQYPERLAARGATNVSVRMKDFVGVKEQAGGKDKYASKRRRAA